MKKREKKEKAKKPLYKRVLSVIVVLFIIMIGIAVLTSGEGETSEPVTTTEETATPALPVQFGEITSVGPLGENVEMIVMSLDESVSEENKIRAVYINAVDYLFTYGSEDLTELSVFGFDAEGNKVITVAFTADLVTALRGIEAEGNWGTEGVAAWFWFNEDAYNILVGSATVIEE